MLEETLFIEKNKPLTPAEDYTFLRETGIAYLQALSGKVWTDYNLHDPGVTILELLCYAITDIGYRSQFSMSDLLTKPGASSPDKTNSFFTAKEIFTTHPIIAEDYRRLLIDIIPGLKNVWLEEIDNADILVPSDNANDNTYFKTRTKDFVVKLDNEKHQLQHLKQADALTEKKLHVHGLYRVKIELDDWETMLADITLSTKIANALNDVLYVGEPKVTLINANKLRVWALYERLVRKTLHEYRNLCEDFEKIAIMKDEQVAICADIEVEASTDVNELLKTIYKIIYNYASPSLNFYSLEEMLAKGKSIEEIYEGTIPNRGFVDYDELKTRFNKQRLVMYTSDIINLIMNVDGVIAVKKLLLTSINETTGKIIHNAEKYCLHLSDPQNFSFRFKHLDKDNKPLNKINFFKANLPFKAKEPDASFVMKESKEPSIFTDDLPVPNGTNRVLDKYYPIQNEFPQFYYTGQERMPEAAATPIRLAQRLQLKGFLLFFDQLLTNYLCQLNHVADLYSWNNASNINTNSFQRLQDITSVGENLIDYVSLENSNSDYNLILNDPIENVARRNRLLDSLLARFNEKFVDYSVFKYTHNNQSLSIDKMKEQVKDKCSFLANYAHTSAYRSHAIDINKPAWFTTNNISGYQQYITSILGLNAYADHYLAKVLRNASGSAVLDVNGKPTYYDTRKISFDKGFGVHIIEHILLRPLAVNTSKLNDVSFLSLCCCDDDKEPDENDYCADPYSMRITVVLPGWLDICIDMEFRKFINTTIRQNAPAHVAVKICWIGIEQMYEYEKTYVAFLGQLSKRDKLDFDKVLDASTYNKALSNFVDVINNLKNVYPPATLHDCEDSKKDVSGNVITRTVILNRTTLGDSWPKNISIKPYDESKDTDGIGKPDTVPPAAPILPIPVPHASAKNKTVNKAAIKNKAAKKKQKSSVIDVVINASNKIKNTKKVVAAKILEETKKAKKLTPKKTTETKKVSTNTTKKQTTKKAIVPVKNKQAVVKKTLQTKKKTNKNK
jgi:hypothetical protein